MASWLGGTLQQQPPTRLQPSNVRAVGPAPPLDNDAYTQYAAALLTSPAAVASMYGKQATRAARCGPGGDRPASGGSTASEQLHSQRRGGARQGAGGARKRAAGGARKRKSVASANAAVLQALQVNGGLGAIEMKRKARSGPESRSSPFIGVSQYKRTGRYEAHIWDSSASSTGGGSGGRSKKSGRQLHLGSFSSAIAAAKAYDRAALCLRGSAAITNFPHVLYDSDPILASLRLLDKDEMVAEVRRVIHHVEYGEENEQELEQQQEEEGAASDVVEAQQGGTPEVMTTRSRAQRASSASRGSQRQQQQQQQQQEMLLLPEPATAASPLPPDTQSPSSFSPPSDHSPRSSGGPAAPAAAPASCSQGSGGSRQQRTATGGTWRAAGGGGYGALPDVDGASVIQELSAADAAAAALAAAAAVAEMLQQQQVLASSPPTGGASLMTGNGQQEHHYQQHHHGIKRAADKEGPSVNIQPTTPNWASNAAVLPGPFNLHEPSAQADKKKDKKRISTGAGSAASDAGGGAARAVATTATPAAPLRPQRAADSQQQHGVQLLERQASAPGPVPAAVSQLPVSSQEAPARGAAAGSLIGGTAAQHPQPADSSRAQNSLTAMLLRESGYTGCFTNMAPATTVTTAGPAPPAAAAAASTVPSGVVSAGAGGSAAPTPQEHQHQHPSHHARDMSGVLYPGADSLSMPISPALGNFDVGGDQRQQQQQPWKLPDLPLLPRGLMSPSPLLGTPMDFASVFNSPPPLNSFFLPSTPGAAPTFGGIGAGGRQQPGGGLAAPAEADSSFRELQQLFCGLEGGAGGGAGVGVGDGPGGGNGMRISAAGGGTPGNLYFNDDSFMRSIEMPSGFDDFLPIGTPPLGLGQGGFGGSRPASAAGNGFGSLGSGIGGGIGGGGGLTRDQDSIGDIAMLLAGGSDLLPLVTDDLLEGAGAAAGGSISDTMRPISDAIRVGGIGTGYGAGAGMELNGSAPLGLGGGFPNTSAATANVPATADMMLFSPAYRNWGAAAAGAGGGLGGAGGLTSRRNAMHDVLAAASPRARTPRRLPSFGMLSSPRMLGNAPGSILTTNIYGSGGRGRGAGQREQQQQAVPALASTLEQQWAMPPPQQPLQQQRQVGGASTMMRQTAFAAPAAASAAAAAAAAPSAVSESVPPHATHIPAMPVARRLSFAAHGQAPAAAAGKDAAGSAAAAAAPTGRAACSSLRSPCGHVAGTGVFEQNGGASQAPAQVQQLSYRSLSLPAADIQQRQLQQRATRAQQPAPFTAAWQLAELQRMWQLQPQQSPVSPDDRQQPGLRERSGSLQLPQLSSMQAAGGRGSQVGPRGVGRDVGRAVAEMFGGEGALGDVASHAASDAADEAAAAAANAAAAVFGSGGAGQGKARASTG